MLNENSIKARRPMLIKQLTGSNVSHLTDRYLLYMNKKYRGVSMEQNT